MKKIFYLIFIALTACGENSVFEPVPECEERGEGTLSILNTSKNPYDIFVNSDWVKAVQGNSTTTINVKSGFMVQVNAEQKSGYLIFPTKVSDKLSISQCEVTSWTIP